MRVVRRAREVVRVRKRVVSEERTVKVTTRREELVVERRPATASDHVDGHPQGSSFDHVFTLSAEEVTIQTRIVPKERVRVWVEPTVEHRAVSGTVRQEHVDVDGGTGPRFSGT